MVYVTDFEGSSFSVKTAGTECGKFTLVSKLRDRVVVVHKLRQLRGTEEFLDCRRNGFDIYEGLSLEVALVLHDSHLFLDTSVETGKTYSELILEQLAYRAYSSVGKVVDIVLFAETGRKTYVVANGRYDIVDSDVLDNEAVSVDGLLNSFFKLFERRIFFHHLLEDGIVYSLFDAELLGVAVYVTRPLARSLVESSEVNGVVADNLEFTFFLSNVDFVDTCILDLHSGSFVHYFARTCKNFARLLVYDVSRESLSRNSRSKAEFFIELISADAHKVVLVLVEENSVYKLGDTLGRRNFTGTQTLVKLDHRFLFGLGVVLCESVCDNLVAAEQLNDFFVSAETERTEQYGSKHFTVTVNVDPKYAVGILLEFQPRASVRSYNRLESLYAGLVHFTRAVNTGTSYQLADDNSLCTVDDERAVVRNDRQFAHKYVLFGDFAG